MFAMSINCVGLPLYVKHIAVVITMQMRLPHFMNPDSNFVGLSMPAARSTIPLWVLPSNDENAAAKSASPITIGAVLPKSGTRSSPSCYALPSRVKHYCSDK